MKNASQNQNRKINHVQLWLFLLLFTTAFFPLGVRGQQTFTCEFSNPDGGIVYPCASVITATINMPAQNNPIQQIQLIFPNSFEITTVDGLPFPPSTIAIPGGIYNGILFSGADLRGQWITVPLNASQMIVTLAYRNCDIYPPINAANLNTNHLFFDCKGFSGAPNNITYNATLIQANPGLTVIGGAAIANHGLTNIPQAIEVIGTPIGVAPYSLTSNNNTYSALNNEIFLRYFDVIVNSTAIQEYNLHITDEIDVDESELFYVSNSGPTLMLPALLDNTGNAVGFGNYSFTFGNVQVPGFNLIPLTAFTTNPNGSRKITFAQRVRKICTDDLEAVVSASFDCGTQCPDQIAPPPPQELTLDADPEIAVTEINMPSITLTSNSAPSNSICGSGFTYEFDYSYSNDVISRLNNFILPINTQSFQVQSVEVGFGNTFTIVPYTIIQPSATSVLNININGHFGTISSPINPCFTNILPNSNPPIYGAWINTNTNVTHLVIRVNLLPIFQTQTPSCPDFPINLSRPAPLNTCTLTLSNTCGGNAPQVVFPVNVATPPITGALITANFPQNIDLGVSPTLPVSYVIQIPEQSPFEIMVDNVPQISCSTTVYQAVLSMGNGALFGNNAIPTATIVANGITTTITPSLNGSGAYVFNLPNIPASQGFYTYSLSFQLGSIACPQCAPPCTTAITYGAYVYNLQVAAICQNCTPEIRRNIICAQNPLDVHCIGTCDSPVGFKHIGALPDIERITLGWIDEYDFKNNPNTPLTASGFNNLANGSGLNQSQIEEQLNSVYPFDLFTYKALGSAKPEPGFTITSVGLQLRYPQTTLGGNFLQLINYEAVFTETNNSSNSFIVNNSNYPLQPSPSIAVPAQTTQPITVAVPSFTQEMQWVVGSSANPVGLFPLGIDINNVSYEITVTATFRMFATTPAGSYGFTINGQFVGESNDGAGTTHHLTSCDPWHTDIKVIIPSAQVIQSSAFTGNINLPTNGSVVGQVNTPNTTACKFGHAIGIRHSGGNGALPDFFPEYRPLTSWPQQIDATNIASGTGFFPGAYTYTVASGNLINGPDPLLPPLTRQLPPNNLQGLVLTLTENCPNSGNLTLPSDLVINRYAYINNQHLITNPPPPSPPTNPTIAAATNLPAGNTNCNFLTLPGGPGIINLSNATPSHIYDFSMQIPASAINLPFAIRITPPINPNVSIPVNNTNIIIPGSTQIGNWFVFNAGLPNTSVIACSMGIQILGNNGCYALPFNIDFEVQVYCNVNQLPTALNQNPVPCAPSLTCNTTQTFQRGAMDLSTANITTSILPNGCDFEFILNLTNPIDQPIIHAAGLILNFSTGMILQQPINLSFSGPGGVITNPNFPYILNQNPNGLTADGIYTLEINGLTLNPGETLTYTLDFQLAEAWCNQLYDPATALFGVSLIAINGCEPFVNIPVNLNQTSIINCITTITQNATCCVPNPEVTVTHVCDATATNGVIVVDYPNFGPGVIARIFRPELCTQNPCSTPIAFTSNPLTINSTNAQFGLGVGTYRLVVWNPATGAFFEQFVVIEDHSFLYANLLGIPSPVCSGTTVQLQANFNTLEPNASNNVTYQINLDGLPIIGASGPIANIMNPNSYSTVINSNGTYSVTLSNGSCSFTSPNITTNLNPTPVIADDAVTICSGDLFNLDPANGTNIVPVGTTYTWSAPIVTGGINGGVAGTSQTMIGLSILSNPTNTDQTATYSVIATSPNGCTSASFVIVVTVAPTPIIAAIPISICSGATFNITPNNGSGNIVPLNTVYSWGMPSLSGNITGATVQNNQTSISQTLTNNTNGSQNAIYEVTASLNGCTSTFFNVHVTVLTIPTPSITPPGPVDICQNSTIQLIASGGNSYSWSPVTDLNNSLIADPVASPTVSTTYVVTVVGPNLCTATASVLVNVIPLPPTPTITAGGPTTFCAGSSVLLSAPLVAGFTYTWMNGTNIINWATSNSLNVTSSGNYSVAMVNANNCTSPNYSNAIQVTVNQPLPAPIISYNGNTTICVGGSLNLVSSYSVFNQWFLNGVAINGATSQTYSATASGNYTVVVTALNNCTSASAPVTVTVLQPQCSNLNTVHISSANNNNTVQGLFAYLNANGYSQNIIMGYQIHDLSINGFPINFELEGEFFIDETIQFFDVSFNCLPGAKITIDHTPTTIRVKFNNCILSACNCTLWQGIINNGAILTINNTTIQNAHTGLTITGSNTQTFLTNSRFYDNYFGVVISSCPLLTFNNWNNEFKNENPLLNHWNSASTYNKWALAGIFLFNSISAVSIDKVAASPGTTFSDINCGILSLNTDLTVNSCYFNEIYDKFPANNTNPNAFQDGSGICQRSTSGNNTLTVLPYEGVSQATTFNMCKNGIAIDHSNAELRYLGFENCRTGILGFKAKSNKVYMEYNRIHALTYGIQYNNIEFVNEFVINHNRINVHSGKSWKGIYLASSAPSSPFISNIKVQQNVVNVNNGVAGIETMNVEFPKVNENEIMRSLDPPIYQVYNNWGHVKTEGCFGADISCNHTLLGPNPDHLPLLGADIQINQSIKSNVSCNTTEGYSDRGLLFESDCSPSKIQTNIIGHHETGLYINGSGFVGAQVSNAGNPNGNRWNGSYGNVGAENANMLFNGISDNQFIVQFSAIPPINQITDQRPSTIPVSTNLPTDWFVGTPAPPVAPCTGGYCPSSLGGISVGPVSPINFNKAVALGIIESVEYTEETKWMLKRNLINELRNNDSLRNSNDTLEVFYYSISQENMRKLQGLADTLKSNQSFVDLTLLVVHANDSILRELNEAIETQLLLLSDSTVIDSVNNIIEQLMANYQTISQANKQMMEGINDQRKDLAAAALAQNTSIVPTNFNEFLERKINDIYLRTLGQDIDSLSTDDSLALESMIRICPMAGGKAIFRARALYNLLNDTIVYNDSLICRQAGYFRQSQEELMPQLPPKEKTSEVSFNLYPNPGKDKLFINFEGDNLQDGVIVFYNALGDRVAVHNIKKENKLTELDITNLAQGYYLVNFTSKNFNANKRFIKLK